MPESLNTPVIPDPIRRGTTTAVGAHEDVSLYEYFETRLHALEQTQRGLVLAQHEYFDASVVALDARLAAQMLAQREITQTRFEASQSAIQKAELSTTAAINKAETNADKRFEQLIKTQTETFSSSIGALDARLVAQIIAQREVTRVQFDASQSAIIKAEIATEKRFEAVNEFRGQLADSQRTFATRESLESWMRESRASHDTLNTDIQKLSVLQTKALAEHTERDNEQHDELRAQLTTLGSDVNGRLSNLEGRMVVVAGGIGIASTLLGALFAIIGHILK